MKRAPLHALSCLVLAVAAAAAASPTPPSDRASYAAHWQAEGLRPVEGSRLDLLYLRPGVASAGAAPLQLGTVQVSLRENWQRADRALERARLRPDEEQKLKDEVAKIVADELRQAFRDAPLLRGGARPVLQAQVVDLYLNAPDLQTAVHTKTYTKQFGDMALVAEVRDGEGGPLLLGSWDHRPARESVTARLTTRVENAVEVRAAAHGWARVLRQEFDRLDAGG